MIAMFLFALLTPATSPTNCRSSRSWGPRNQKATSSHATAMICCVAVPLLPWVHQGQLCLWALPMRVRVRVGVSVRVEGREGTA